MSTTITDAFVSQYPNKDLASPLSAKGTLKILDSLYDSIDKEIASINRSLRHGGHGPYDGQSDVKRMYAMQLEDQKKFKKVEAKFDRIRKEFGRALFKLHMEVHKEDCHVEGGEFDAHDDDLVEKIIYAIADDIFNKVRELVMIEQGTVDLEIVELTAADWGDE